MSARTRVPSRVPPARLLASATLVFVAVAGALLTGPATAAAQDANSLQSIEPADGASLPASPTAITLAFNQELRDDDTVTLTLTCGTAIQDTGIPEVDDDGLVVTVAVQQPVPRGACHVTWQLRDGLGELIVGDQSTFAVTADPPAAATADDAGDDTAGATGGSTATTSPFIEVPAVAPTTAAADEVENQGSAGAVIWFGRLLSTLGILVLFGSLVLISVGWPEGPEYVVTVRFLRACWILGLLGTLIFVVAYAADFAGTSFGSGLSPGAWLDLADDGWEGRGALLRLVFVAACGWVAMRPERIIDPQTAMWAWLLPGVGLIAVAMSRVGGPAALIGFLVNVVHVVAVAVWIGGAALVARVVLAGPGEEDLVQATRAFTRVSVPAMLVAAVTGIIQVVRLDGGDLFGSSHGRVLLLKVVAVAAMLAVALAARQQVGLRLDRARELTVPLADRFRRAFGAEAALGVVVLAFSGWMLALTPAKVDPLADQDYLPAIPFNDQVSGLQAKVFIGPGRVGPNALKVEVADPAEGITNLTLRFLPPPGSTAFAIEQAIPLTTSGTAYLEQSDGIPLLAAGQWTLQLDASTATGVIESAATTFLVVGTDGSVVTTPPTEATSPVSVSIVDPVTTLASFATTTAPTTSTPGSTPSD